ncbi:hypothetical protein HELRODRAFT_171489 [Helobdella robusta]|uniref:Uncharacterized protein n=1 Tax=Helobdella robusta TaxID=6412 RepID=T1F4C7_HELRO|nr:hypothetical protein HELRODRAFT_171489 [Helobdella robusta]ESO05155.1 hypothetical protein HELRODRAFT_171489 [Helobdella robusta]
MEKYTDKTVKSKPNNTKKQTKEKYKNKNSLNRSQYKVTITMYYFLLKMTVAGLALFRVQTLWYRTFYGKITKIGTKLSGMRESRKWGGCWKGVSLYIYDNLVKNAVLDCAIIDRNGISITNIEYRTLLCKMRSNSRFDKRLVAKITFPLTASRNILDINDI